MAAGWFAPALGVACTRSRRHDPAPDRHRVPRRSLAAASAHVAGHDRHRARTSRRTRRRHRQPLPIGRSRLGSPVHPGAFGETAGRHRARLSQTGAAASRSDRIPPDWAEAPRDLGRSVGAVGDVRARGPAGVRRRPQGTQASAPALAAERTLLAGLEPVDGDRDHSDRPAPSAGHRGDRGFRGAAAEDRCAGAQARVLVQNRRSVDGDGRSPGRARACGRDHGLADEGPARRHVPAQSADPGLEYPTGRADIQHRRSDAEAERLPRPGRRQSAIGRDPLTGREQGELLDRAATEPGRASR